MFDSFFWLMAFMCGLFLILLFTLCAASGFLPYKVQSWIDDRIFGKDRKWKSTKWWEDC